VGTPFSELTVCVLRVRFFVWSSLTFTDFVFRSSTTILRVYRAQLLREGSFQSYFGYENFFFLKNLILASLTLSLLRRTLVSFQTLLKRANAGSNTCFWPFAKKYDFFFYYISFSEQLLLRFSVLLYWGIENMKFPTLAWLYIIFHVVSWRLAHLHISISAVYSSFKSIAFRMCIPHSFLNFVDIQCSLHTVI